MSLEPRHLDGNAVGGVLIEAFGREMTEAIERCGGCGSIRELGALRAYLRGPGDVLRCPDCGCVLLVIVRVGDRVRVSARSIAWLELP
jgi:DNA-directed RNA polymerase subunit RPC12/RpoP